VFLPHQGHSLNPLRQARVVARGVERQGGRLRRGAVTALTREGSRVTGVATEAGKVEADQVVIATGAWSARLLQPLGIHVPLQSQRGYHVMLPEPGVMPRRPVVPADRKVFITPMEEGLRVAGTVEFGGTEAPPNAARAALLVGDLAQVYPQARAEGAKPFWMGHRPCLPDSLPVLGPGARLGGAVVRLRARAPGPDRLGADGRADRRRDAGAEAERGPVGLRGGAVRVTVSRSRKAAVASPGEGPSRRVGLVPRPGMRPERRRLAAGFGHGAGRGMSAGRPPAGAGAGAAHPGAGGADDAALGAAGRGAADRDGDRGGAGGGRRWRAGRWCCPSRCCWGRCRPGPWAAAW
jgi:glycine/D-amino acid oxidase-like deaminating enzyme